MININNITGEYQNIEVNGTLLKKGLRECDERWKMIKPYIKSNSTVIDIGSFHGYFGIKICREIKNTTVLSIESNRRWAEEQKQIVEMNKLMNLAVSNHTFSLNDLEWLDNVVEGIDYFIMLSSLEYFPKKDVEKILEYISRICPNLIVEFPEKAETKAAGQEIIQYLYPLEECLKKYFNKVQIIGEPVSTTDKNLFRKIYLAENSFLHRTLLHSSKDHVKSRKHVLRYENGQWEIEETIKQKRKWIKQKKEWISGFNLHNLLKFNIIYPTKSWFLENARNEYLRVFNEFESISDISLKNLLFTTKGIEAIDYLEIKKIDNLDKFEEAFKRFITEQIK